ncbi:MAG: AzlD domain-containing protein [Deltaproteobacteria bacterium]|nr:AzlD domain-containing protein [Deltaproteobacteria bacterium]
MEERLILVTVLLMSVVTMVPRILPVWLLAGRTLPRSMVIWLRYVPVSVLSALLLPELFIKEGQFDLSSSNLYLWIALPTMLVAAKTKSLAVTLVTGIGGVALLRLLVL